MPNDALTVAPTGTPAAPPDRAVDTLFLDAITRALELEMDADPDVFLTGSRKLVK